MPSTIGTGNLNGPYTGYSPQQTINNFKDGNDAITRKILRKSWNGAQTAQTINGFGRVITPFRAVNNAGDYLNRQHYVCGGPNPINSRADTRGLFRGSILSFCDKTNIPATNGNGRYVVDSSTYTVFRKQRAYAKNYNDVSSGGDQSNASYVNVMAIHRR